MSINKSYYKKDYNVFKKVNQNYLNHKKVDKYYRQGKTTITINKRIANMICNLDMEDKYKYLINEEMKLIMYEYYLLGRQFKKLNKKQGYSFDTGGNDKYVNLLIIDDDNGDKNEYMDYVYYHYCNSLIYNTETANYDLINKTTLKQEANTLNLLYHNYNVCNCIDVLNKASIIQNQGNIENVNELYNNITLTYEIVYFQKHSNHKNIYNFVCGEHRDKMFNYVKKPKKNNKCPMYWFNPNYDYTDYVDNRETFNNTFSIIYHHTPNCYYIHRQNDMLIETELMGSYICENFYDDIDCEKLLHQGQNKSILIKRNTYKDYIISMFLDKLTIQEQNKYVKLQELEMMANIKGLFYIHNNSTIICKFIAMYFNCICDDKNIDKIQLVNNYGEECETENMKEMFMNNIISIVNNTKEKQIEFLHKFFVNMYDFSNNNIKNQVSETIVRVFLCLLYNNTRYLNVDDVGYMKQYYNRDYKKNKKVPTELVEKCLDFIINSPIIIAPTYFIQNTYKHNTYNFSNNKNEIYKLLHFKYDNDYTPISLYVVDKIKELGNKPKYNDNELIDLFNNEKIKPKKKKNKNKKQKQNKYDYEFINNIVNDIVNDLPINPINLNEEIENEIIKNNNLENEDSESDEENVKFNYTFSFNKNSYFHDKEYYKNIIINTYYINPRLQQLLYKYNTINITNILHKSNNERRPHFNIILYNTNTQAKSNCLHLYPCIYNKNIIYKITEINNLI